jgi:hypothetical protein
MSHFTSEDDLKTFEGWLKYQGYDPTTLAPDDLAQWRDHYNEISKWPDAKVGLMKLGLSVPGDRIYAVAVRDSDLWLTLWVRQSWKLEFFVFMPRADGSNIHASYHRDGTFHQKSNGRVIFSKKLSHSIDCSRERSTSADTWGTAQKPSVRSAIPTYSLAWSSFRPGCWDLAMARSSSTSSSQAAIRYGGPEKWFGRRSLRMPCHGL